MRRLAMLMLIALVAAACNGSAGGSPPADAGAASPSGGSASAEPDAQEGSPGRSRYEPSHVVVEVEGEHDFRWEEDDDLLIATVLPPPGSADHVRLLSIGFEEVRPYVQGSLFRFAFDLLGDYDGPGEYIIAASTDEDARASGPMSGAFLIVAQLEDADGELTRENLASVAQFDQVLEDCALTVGEDEREGSLDCPKLADADGNEISLHVTWSPPT